MYVGGPTGIPFNVESKDLFVDIMLSVQHILFKFLTSCKQKSLLHVYCTLYFHVVKICLFYY